MYPISAENGTISTPLEITNDSIDDHFAAIKNT